MNHRHADFQSCAICGCSIASRPISVKPLIRDQRLRGGLSNHRPSENRPHSVDSCLSIIREARQLFGDATAKRLWHELGLPVPESGSPTGRIYRPRPDVTEFLSSYLIHEPSAELPASIAFAAFTRWLKASDRPAVSLTAFGRAMRSANRCIRGERGIIYIGLRLPNEHPPDPLSSGPI